MQREVFTKLGLFLLFHMKKKKLKVNEESLQSQIWITVVGHQK